MNHLQQLLAQEDFSKEDIQYLLSLSEKEEMNALFMAAYQAKRKYTGTKVYFRGLIELSNICVKNCFYCGIRRDNTSVSRYIMSEEEVLAAAEWAWKARYGSIVIQTGERSDENFIVFIEKLVREIKALSSGQLGITLSLGEQTEDTYRRWFAAGAHRYLLRIETSNPVLYAQLHPEDHKWETRVKCLELLKRVGFQTGTGVMTGLPGQRIKDLAEDILFFKSMGIGMIGMGPYIPHHDTPLYEVISDFETYKKKQLFLALRMIAVTRLVLKTVNIAATTALQSLSPTGREQGLLAGANIIMPNITDTKYRQGYQLYDGKPCMDENAAQCVGCLSNRIASIGEEVGWEDWGDAPFYKNHKNES